MRQTTTINIEISQPNIPVAVHAKQHDSDTRVIEVSLFDKWVAYNPPYDVSGIVNIGKPDGTGCYYDVDDITGNKITFTLVEQSLTAAGTAHAEISLVGANEERLTSFKFDIIIEKRVLEDSVIVSSDYFNALINASSAYIKHATLLKVQGYYATLADLTSAITEPNGGDMYAVGTAAPYDIYVYDPVSETWINNGALGQSGTVYLGVTSGTADALTISDYPNQIVDGYTFTLTPHVNVNTGATLQIGNNNALPLLSHEGTPIPSNMMFQNVPITLIYRQLPTPAYVTAFDTGTIAIPNRPYVEGTKLKWSTGTEDLRGYYVNDVSLKSGSTAAGQTATYAMTLNDPDETEIGTFDVYNGADGQLTGLTANRAVITNSSGAGASSDTTATEIGYVHGVTSNIQTQINSINNVLNYNNAGAHNSIYRGKYLGDALTTAQSDAIRAGTFDDIYIGDYWTIGGRNYYVCDCDYFYHGVGWETNHHVVVVSGSNYASTKMNSTATAASGYFSSEGRAALQNTGIPIIKSAFGESHIMNHTLFLSTSVDSNGIPTMEEKSCQLELFSESMLYGSRILSSIPANISDGVGEMLIGQQRPLSIFRLNPWALGMEYNIWLRDVYSQSSFIVNRRMIPTIWRANGGNCGLNSYFCVY